MDVAFEAVIRGELIKTTGSTEQWFTLGMIIVVRFDNVDVCQQGEKAAPIHWTVLIFQNNSRKVGISSY